MRPSRLGRSNWGLIRLLQTDKVAGMLTGSKCDSADTTPFGLMCGLFDLSVDRPTTRVRVYPTLSLSAAVLLLV